MHHLAPDRRRRRFRLGEVVAPGVVEEVARQDDAVGQFARRRCAAALLPEGGVGGRTAGAAAERRAAR
jgi:hypothetical protein